MTFAGLKEIGYNPIKLLGQQHRNCAYVAAAFARYSTS